MTKTIALFIISLIIFSQVSAQNMSDNIRLAYKYYQEKEYEKAEILFGEIYKKTKVKIYFTYYTNCLIELSKFDLAEKQIKKELRKHKEDITFYVDLGYLYKKQNKLDLAEKQFNIAIKKVSYNRRSIITLANTFINRREYELAEKTYLEGQKKTSEDFNMELANIYAIQRKHELMIKQYLDMITVSTKKLGSIQNRLQFYINNDVNKEFSNLLKTELIKRIQKTTKTTSYNQMLVWLFMQQKEFSKALIQAKAIDKRINAPGKKIIELAKTAISNKDYNTALDAYQYVIEKGRNRPFYIEAKTGKLDVLYMQVLDGEIKTQEQIAELELEFTTTIKSLGLGRSTIKSVIGLAHLQAFYLNKPEEGRKLLQDAIKVQGIPPLLEALCKIELGDILLYENDLWQAVLIYGQAEKDNKENYLGDIAKLRKAKLAYYANNFQWAKAQFDALKASTSKPVANDAIFYSILIEQNTKDDSIHLALNKYANAELKVFQNKKDSAHLILDSLITDKTSQLVDESYLLKAEIFVQEKKYNKAIEYLKKIITEYSYEILTDIAVFRIAQIYDTKINDKENAAEYYKKLMIEYPESIYVAESRELFRKIREK